MPPEHSAERRDRETSSDEPRQATPAQAAAETAAPGATTEPHQEPEQLTNRGVDRSEVIGEGVRNTATWCLRLLIIGIFTAALLWLLGKVWVGVFPTLMALILATVLWPPARWLRRHSVPAGLSAAMVILGAFAVIGGILGAIAPSVVDQAQELSNTAVQGVAKVQTWLTGPPLNVAPAQIHQITHQVTSWMQGNGKNIAAGVFAGIGTLGNSLVTMVMVLVMTFFFIKDGVDFLPWTRRLVGRRAGRHLTEVSTRLWNTLSGYVRAQAAVSAVDGVLIGSALLIMGVPLAIPLAILTFLGGFIPIVGAVTVGTLSVLVALVSNGFGTALIILGVVVLVQQLEGNVLTPLLQGRSMQLHGVVVLLSVAAGGTLFGIVGAFLAVPFAASVAVIMRYLSEQIDLRTGDLAVADAPVVTKEGEESTRLAGRAAARWARRSQRKHAETEEDSDDEESRGKGLSRFLPGQTRDSD